MILRHTVCGDVGERGPHVLAGIFPTTCITYEQNSSACFLFTCCLNSVNTEKTFPHVHIMWRFSHYFICIVLEKYVIILQFFCFRRACMFCIILCKPPVTGKLLCLLEANK
jgi:hypothetical protein